MGLWVGGYKSLISIHALLAESDCFSLHTSTGKDYFYPRSPCGERPIACGTPILAEQFLSTLSLRRATCCRRCNGQSISDFYPRSPCGERLGLPVAGRIARRISIHALLAESDNFRCSIKRPISNFYPRSPCGERLILLIRIIGFLGFLSTLSLRRATYVSYS